MKSNPGQVTIMEDQVSFEGHGRLPKPAGSLHPSLDKG